jgi:hypothetical protein
MSEFGEETHALECAALERKLAAPADSLRAARVSLDNRMVA